MTDALSPAEFLARLGALIAVLIATVFVVGVVAGAPPALATCGDACTDVVDYYSTFSVARPPVGTIVSDVVGGNQINCPASGAGTCSVTDVRTVAGIRPTTGWPAYTLAAQLPTGYAPRWTTPCSGSADTCRVVNNAENGPDVGLTMADVQAPSAPGITIPDFVSPTTVLQAGGSDTSGTVSYDWGICDQVECRARSEHGSQITFGSDATEGATYTVWVSAVDPSGNVGPASSKTVTYDSQAPTVFVANPAADTVVYGPNVTIWYQASDAHLGWVSCGVDDNPLVDCTSAPNWTATGLTVGSTHTVTGYAADRAGNFATTTRMLVATGLPINLDAHSDLGGAIYDLVASGFPADATGRVDFNDGAGDALCTAQVADTEAWCTVATPKLAADGGEVVADYSGDANLFPSRAQVHVDPPGEYSLTAAADHSTLAYGTKHVLHADGLPTNLATTVTFTSDGATLCTAKPASGAARCTATGTSLLPGRHTIVAVAPGDQNWVGESASFPVTVSKGTPELTASPASARVRRGHTVTLAVRGVPNGGAVTFVSGRTTLCTAHGVRGHASCTAPVMLPVGTHAVLARCRGNALWRAASATARLTVVR